MINSDPTKTTTILGRFKADMARIINDEIGLDRSSEFGPKIGGYNILNVDPAEYSRLGAEVFWNVYNKPFLIAAIKRGDNIAIATRPTTDSLYDAGELT